MGNCLGFQLNRPSFRRQLALLSAGLSFQVACDACKQANFNHQTFDKPLLVTQLKHDVTMQASLLRCTSGTIIHGIRSRPAVAMRSSAVSKVGLKEPNREKPPRRPQLIVSHDVTVEP